MLGGVLNVEENLVAGSVWPEAGALVVIIPRPKGRTFYGLSSQSAVSF